EDQRPGEAPSFAVRAHAVPQTGAGGSSRPPGAYGRTPPTGPGVLKLAAACGRRGGGISVDVVLAVVAAVVAGVGIAVAGVLLDVDAREHDAGDVGAGLEHLAHPGQHDVARRLLPAHDIERLVDDAGQGQTVGDGADRRRIDDHQVV